VKQWDIPATYTEWSIQELKNITLLFTPSFENVENSTNKSIGGIVAKDTQRDLAIQVMQNRLTINKLAPYTDFALLKNEAQLLWQHYARTFQPEQIQRVGLRYVNEIEMQQVLSHYIQSELLPTGELIEQTVRSYHRYEIQRTETFGAVVQIVVNTENSRLIVDIDTFSERPYESNETMVWDESVEQLHTFKNELFFAVITDDYAKECE
jgi:uncharacterized protein (TIGR04255 family)